MVNKDFQYLFSGWRRLLAVVAQRADFSNRLQLGDRIENRIQSELMPYREPCSGRSTRLDLLSGVRKIRSQLVDSYWVWQYWSLVMLHPVMSHVTHTVTGKKVAYRDSSFWQCKAYANIRGDSLDRGVKQLWACRERQFKVLLLSMSSKTSR